jgi:hypothetical protein
VRTLPYLRAWYDRYHADGLEIVGVHSPEFDFEKRRANVERAVEKLKVTWPVALDPDLKVWNAFGNQYWPAKYVVDRQGRLRFFHPGEGNYDQVEDVLRELLGVDPHSPRADDGGNDTKSPPTPEPQTPETYVGGARGTTVSPQGLQDPDKDGEQGGKARFTVPKHIPDDAFALDGRWSIEAESATALEAGAAIVLDYHGSEVNLVLATGGGPDAKPSTVTVTIDDGQPRRVDVGAPDLVNLVKDGPSGRHTLRVEADAPGLSAYAFTFG